MTELEINNNVTFYPNVCHVCKTREDTEVKLITCECHMITYCSVILKQEHQPEHKDICEIFQNLILQREWDIFASYTEPKLWHHQKNKLMDKVSVLLKRKMKRYEKEMILFPRSCLECHVQYDVTPCPFCACHNACNNHINTFFDLHKHYCNALKLCFLLDFYHSVYNVHNALMLKFIPQIRPSEFSNIACFLKHYVDNNISDVNNLVTDILPCLFSEYITRPLTIYFALSKNIMDANISNCISLKIHILSLDLPNMITAHGWEILLHLLPNLSILSVKIIDAKQQVNMFTWLNLCHKCIAASKMCNVEYLKTSYDLYKNSKYFVKPDIIARFTNGLYHEDLYLLEEFPISGNDLRAIALIECPVIWCYLNNVVDMGRVCLFALMEENLTSYIHSGIPSYSGINPYRSLRPYRNFKYETVYYDNNFIYLFKFNKYNEAKNIDDMKKKCLKYFSVL